jgi:hypothetical protein
MSCVLECGHEGPHIGTNGEETANDTPRMLAKLRMILKHAKQGQTDPRFAKDQCWEIEQLAKEALGPA